MLSVGQQPTFRLNYERSLSFFFGGAELSKNEPKKMIVLECLFLTIALCDAAEPWQLGSQDAAIPMMQGIIVLHHDIFFFLILNFVFVSWILVRALWHFHYKKNPKSVPIMENIFLLSIFISFFFLFYDYFDLIETADCAGKDSGEGAPTSYPKPAWQIALDLPDNQSTSECLRSHIKEQLRYLFNIGRKTTLFDTMFSKFIKPLNLDEASMGFSKALLDRVNQLQLAHFNEGTHIPFKFCTKREKEKLYSIVWDYAKKITPE